MATTSTQRPAGPQSNHGPNRSVREIINGRARDVICIDSDDDMPDARPSPAPSEAVPLASSTLATAAPPPPAAATQLPAGADDIAPPPARSLGSEDAEFVPPNLVSVTAPRRSTRQRVQRYDPASFSDPSASTRSRARKRPAAEEAAPSSTNKRSRVGDLEQPERSRAAPGTLRAAVGASRLDDPSFAAPTTSSKRKRTSDGDTAQNKVARTTSRTQAHASAAAVPSAPTAYDALPSVAAPYPIPPVPATASTRPPVVSSSAWPAARGVVAQRPRPRMPPVAGSSSNVVSPDVPPPQAGLPIDDAEGHFIVRPGDSITPRFKILAQLGQGTFGKVVECFDRKERSRVAIKVIRAVQKYRDASQIEIRVLRTLREHDPHNENRCIHLVSTFNYKNHVCIVSELLSKSVFDFLKENEFHAFPSTHIWSFAKQLLKSVAFLHSLQLVHTDLKPENILLEDTDYVTKPYSSRSPNSKRWKILKNTALRLIDFGSATFNDEYHSAVVSTRHYRAPEIMLGMGWSFPCDVWSIGCILIEFHTGDALFQTHDNLEHLALMDAALGKMPDDFRRRAERLKPEYFHGAKLNFPNKQTHRQSARFVKGMKHLSQLVNYPSAYQKHNTRFLHLLTRLLDYDPTKRITVHDALKHPYFDLSANEFPP